MRVFANTFGQAGAQGIGDDVARNTTQVFIVAQCMIVKSALPNLLSENQRHLGLVHSNRLGQASIFFKLKQPMNMIWHDDESQSLHMVRDISVMQTAHRCARCNKMSKNRLAGCSNGGYQIGMIRQGNTAFAKIFSVGLFFGIVQRETLPKKSRNELRSYTALTQYAAP